MRVLCLACSPPGEVFNEAGPQPEILKFLKSFQCDEFRACLSCRQSDTFSREIRHAVVAEMSEEIVTMLINKEKQKKLQEKCAVFFLSRY